MAFADQDVDFSPLARWDTSAGLADHQHLSIVGTNSQTMSLEQSTPYLGPRDPTATGQAM